MKVYIVTGEPFPNGMAATNRIKCYAKAIISQGIDCEVIVIRKTESPANPHNTIGLGIADNVIPFRYVLGSPIPNKNYFIRNIQGLTAKRCTIHYLKKRLNKSDVVFGYLGNNVDLIVKLIDLAHNKGAVFCRELNEYPFVTVEESRFQREKTILYEKIFPRLDGIIVISDALYKYVKPLVSNTCIIQKIPILVDYIQFAIPDKSSINSPPFIFHAGTLTEKKDGFIGMLEAFAIAVKKVSYSLRFIIAGNIDNSPDKERILYTINEYNLKDKVIFLGLLKTEEILKYLSKASLVILNKYPNQQNQYGFSTKLGEYLAAGKPVIMTKVGEAMNWLVDGVNSYVIDYGDVQQLANTIVRAFENDEERMRIGRNARMLCEKCFDYKQYGNALVDMFEQMIKSKYNKNI